MWNLFITFVTQFIPAVWLAATHEVTQLKNGPTAKKYQRIFLWLAIIAIGAPICLTGLAIVTKAGWLIALIGLILACFLAIMLFNPIYIGLTVLLGAVWNLLNLNVKGTADVGTKWAKAYINIVGGFLLWELLVIFFISVFPIWNNLAALPIIALCSVLLPLMISIWGLGGRIFRRAAYLFVLFVLIFEIGSLAFPLSGKAVIAKRPKMDEKMAKWIENPSLPKLPSKAQAELPPKKEPITELACATVIVPAGEILNTHFFVRPRQRVYFKYLGVPSKNPESPLYYIHPGPGCSDIPVYSEEYSCTSSNSDYVFLKGGAVTSMVTLNK